MKRALWVIIGTILGCWLSMLAYAAAPTRDNTYISGTVINPDKVMANENTIYTYLQNGVDTYASGSIPTAALQNDAVTSTKILDGTITTSDLAFTITNGNILPAGAIFFMLTSNCPSWTTDISSTYEGYFIRASATQGTTGGDTTHTHGAGSFVGPVHTHTVPRDGWGATDVGISGRIATAENSSAGNALATATGDNTSGSGGGGAITGTSASASNLPTFVTAKLCRVN